MIVAESYYLGGNADLYTSTFLVSFFFLVKPGLETQKHSVNLGSVLKGGKSTGTTKIIKEKSSESTSIVTV